MSLNDNFDVDAVMDQVRDIGREKVLDIVNEVKDSMGNDGADLVVEYSPQTHPDDMSLTISGGTPETCQRLNKLVRERFGD